MHLFLLNGDVSRSNYNKRANSIHKSRDTLHSFIAAMQRNIPEPLFTGRYDVLSYV